MTIVAIKYDANLATSFKAANVRFHCDAESTHMDGQKSRWQKTRSPRDEVRRCVAVPGQDRRRLRPPGRPDEIRDTRIQLDFRVFGGWPNTTRGRVTSGGVEGSIGG